MTEQQLTHIDDKGDVRMVDVSAKADTQRVAVAARPPKATCWRAPAWRE